VEAYQAPDAGEATRISVQGRCGEAVRIRWPALDLDAGELRVTGTLEGNRPGSRREP